MGGPLVLGIDAGFTATGLVLVELRRTGLDRVVAAKALRTFREAKKRGIRVADDDAERCMALAAGIQAFADQAVHDLRAVAVELPHAGAKGARAQRAMGMAAGIVASVVALQGWAAEWVTAAQVKRASAGANGASKADVQAGVLRLLDWSAVGPVPRPEWEDVADAAGAVLAIRGGPIVRMLRQGA